MKQSRDCVISLLGYQFYQFKRLSNDIAAFAINAQRGKISLLTNPEKKWCYNFSHSKVTFMNYFCTCL